MVELCNGGDLESLINAGLKLNEKHVSYIYGQVLKGMRDMKKLRVVHRDIKNANILVSIPETALK
jgi:serine/threonine protein kinase